MEYDKLTNWLNEYAKEHNSEMLGGFDENGNSYVYTIITLDGQQYSIGINKVEE